jgi:hypothetical protein
MIIFEYLISFNMIFIHAIVTFIFLQSIIGSPISQLFNNIF